MMEESKGIVFLRAIRAAIGRPAVWLSCWAVLMAAGGALALPWIPYFDSTLSHHYEPGSVRASLAETFRFDHQDGLGSLSSVAADNAAWFALFMMLFGAFAAGGWLQVCLERAGGRTIRRFLWGGARYFKRFFRVWLCTLLLLAFVSWLCHGWVWETMVLDWVFGATADGLEDLDSERSAFLLRALQSGVFALLFSLVLVWGDYTRTRLALHDGRSALWAGLCTLGLLIANPLRTLRPFALILLVEALVLWGLGSLSWGMSTGLDAEASRWSMLSLFLVGQAAVVWRVISRGARYHAAVAVSRVLVPPIERPDRWSKRIGGPGGPQYPIDDSDDYGVSF